MVIDVHCHVGYSARRLPADAPRFSFESGGDPASGGLDSYFSPRLMAKWDRLLRWRTVQRAMKITWDGRAGERLDRQIDAFNARHFDGAKGVDRLVLLAFDACHGDDGSTLAPSPRRGAAGGDLYVSNSLVRRLCDERPDRYLLGASVHPYRRIGSRDAVSALEELKAAGAVLIKWLPIHQNIRADDPRTIAFLRRAADLRLAMLIHYGGEMTLAAQHPEFEHPGPMLNVLRGLHREGRMPTTIVAHAATPSLPLHSADGHRTLIRALCEEFADAPLYADVSALAALGRAPWLLRVARNRPLHRKLVWGTDFPIPVFPILCWRALWGRRKRLDRIDSWIERDLELKRAVGLDESVFHRAEQILELPVRD